MIAKARLLWVRWSNSPDHPADDAALEREERRVLGDDIFSSGHPSMQLLNPKVDELFLSFRSL